MERYMRCPHCGFSDGNDDKILSHRMTDKSYNGGELTILEERECDICHKIYEVNMFYMLKYEELVI